MSDRRLDRRAFIGGGSAAATLMLPGIGGARRPGADWPQVQATLDGYVADDRIPGAAAAIGRGTEQPHFLAAGTIGRDSKRPVDADSLFRVYSMTKPITGIAAMMLIEDGRIDLDQGVADFVATFREPRVLIDGARDLTTRPAIRPVTIRNLMTHTGGIGYAIVSKGPLLAEYIRLGLTAGVASRMTLPGYPHIVPAPSLEAFADRIGTVPLIADPGTRWSYSAGLDVLGRVIEVAGGMAFERFLQTRLFDPLGMASSFFRVPRSQRERMTTNYGILPDHKIPIDAGATTIFADPPPFAMGGAGLVMSARDYDCFLQMLVGEGAIGRTRIMKRETAKLAMSNLMPATVVPAMGFDNGQGFGAGARVVTRPDANGAGIGTFGWGGAAATVGWVDRSRGLRASGFAQFMPDSAMPFTADFAKAVYDGS